MGFLAFPEEVCLVVASLFLPTTVGGADARAGEQSLAHSPGERKRGRRERERARARARGGGGELSCPPLSVLKKTERETQRETRRDGESRESEAEREGGRPVQEPQAKKRSSWLQLHLPQWEHDTRMLVR